MSWQMASVVQQLDHGSLVTHFLFGVTYQVFSNQTGRVAVRYMSHWNKKSESSTKYFMISNGPVTLLPDNGWAENKRWMKPGKQVMKPTMCTRASVIFLGMGWLLLSVYAKDFKKDMWSNLQKKLKVLLQDTRESAGITSIFFDSMAHREMDCCSFTHLLLSHLES